MRRRTAVPLFLTPVLLAGCATSRPAGTLAELHRVEPDLQDAQVDEGLDQAMQAYRRYLEETPVTAMTPEAIRRLADLQVEKQFGIRNGPAMPQPISAPLSAETPAGSAAFTPAAGDGRRESQQDFERRASAASTSLPAADEPGLPGDLPGGVDPKGPLEAIALYERLLKEYPSYQNSDQVLYQMARAYDELGKTEQALEIMDRLMRANPQSAHADEVQFRRGEYFFMRRRFRDAENAYATITARGTGSSFYELALYKLGWTFYKQDLYDEALQQYMALIDYKVSNGYDFDARHEEEDERRVADTFRVVSLSFSNLGGPEAVQRYFATAGDRPYENRVYTNLGDHYLEKLRYDDAAKTFKTFVALHPFHKAAPQFSMRVVETFTKGGFPKLVLESKRDFASLYGVTSDYWKHNKQEDAPEVIAYLKGNLKDLATHYHAQYQGTKKTEEKTGYYGEARRWYGDYLASFPTDAETPSMNYRLADLMLENKDFGEAAKQYERTAYDYPSHEKSAAAGYAAVYAHREQLKAAGETERDAVRRETVVSSVRFADAFPDHEHAAAILGAAADDLYEMKDYPAAVATATRVLEKYPKAETELRRTAWTVVAHGSFETAQYPQAEKAYGQVLAATPGGDESYAALVDNLAASIYRQGEQAREKQDYRAAADHFLRIKTAAPTSKIRPAAEYDAGTALMALKDWNSAAQALETFRTDFPEHKLRQEATRQIALAYKESGQVARAAGEYERLASQSEDPAIRSESLLLAGDLYAQSQARDRALEVYQRYVTDFPRPIETALETRSKIAEMHKTGREDGLYRKQLKEIVRIDAEAGKERTGRTRTLAGRSALVLAEPTYAEFTAVKLKQPFEKSLQEKKQRMDTAIDAMDGLVEYEIADVTAAATYYIAETYLDFSRSLMESERPADLPAAQMAEYEAALDEEAYPFEEKSIDFHQKNLEMMRQGSVNTWTEKSLARLAELVPGRFAKQEISTGPWTSLDGFVYRTPLSLMPPPPPATPDAAPTGKPQLGAPMAEPPEAAPGEASNPASKDGAPKAPPKEEPPQQDSNGGTSSKAAPPSSKGKP